MKSALSIAALFVALSASAAFAKPPIATPVQAQDSYYATAHEAVAGRAKATPVRGKAKNVILFVGDGMGVSSITAGRIYTGQSKGQDGESYRLSFENLPFSALSRTYTHDAQVADSAPTATAMTTGVKTLNGTIGLRKEIKVADCASRTGAETDSLWEIAEKAGLAAGVVSTARLTHATPAATFAETVERDWESDSQVPAEAKAQGCTDIAAQFIAWNKSFGDGFEVALGGGRQMFLPKTSADPEYADKKGERADGRNLINEWTTLGADHKVVTDKAGFDAIDWKSGARVLGLFEPSHMQYDIDRAKDKAGEPSLAELTRAAITRLSQDKDGYVLMVEAGRIDHGHHGGNAARALGDVAALDEAVKAALEATNARDTLILVTADHSHVLTIAGYPSRNNPILATVREGGVELKAADGKPFTTLGYMNGPGAVCKKMDADGERCVRPDLTGVNTQDPNYKQQALIPLGSETHGGEDVPIFASGPGAELVRGSMEQQEIFHVLARALRLAR